MSQQFAKDQPKGFNNHLQNIAIVGAGGQIGKFITEAILKKGKHNLTAITRADGGSQIPAGVTIQKVDYADQNSIVEALKGQDALIITMGVMAPPDQQSKLIEAAAIAGVPWVFPNEFGGTGANEQAGKDIMLGPMKQAVREQIEKLGKSSWIGIACNFWYEFSLAGGFYRYGFDMKKKTAIFFDDGLTKIFTSTWPQTGRAVAQLLALKVLPEDENDTTLCLSNYRNKFMQISSFKISQRDMLDSILRVTGDKESDWKITKRPVQEVYKEGTEMLKAGKRVGFGQLLYARYFYPDMAEFIEGRDMDLDNEKLGLEKEDLDEFTKEAVRLFETGYFDSEFKQLGVE
ncbi:CipA protein [Tricladium varicosporioides]|nr:CipA protein [Hymenoscyphus varicosporioides]